MCNMCIERSDFLPFVLPLPKSFGTTKYRKLRYVERRTTAQNLLEIDRVVIPCFGFINFLNLCSLDLCKSREAAIN
ncbi:hypothetical protein QR685DRAFT_239236 [Neurospora intermedia]|uniref:Uncharacterized protein n=1 Tax=Neurospora intermedia TaxID=5142 RepID=A0ABR3DIN9_NEUIN